MDKEKSGDLANQLLLEAVDCIMCASALVADEPVSATLVRRAGELEQFAGGGWDPAAEPSKEWRGEPAARRPGVGHSVAGAR